MSRSVDKPEGESWVATVLKSFTLLAAILTILVLAFLAWSLLISGVDTSSLGDLR